MTCTSRELHRRELGDAIGGVYIGLGFPKAVAEGLWAWGLETSPGALQGGRYFLSCFNGFVAVDRGLQLLAVTNFACCLSRLLHLQHRCPECDIFEMTLLHLQVRHLREDTSASTTPPPRVGKLRDDAPSPHPLEAALLRDEQPPVNQHQILEDYLKQVLASAGLVSQEHFPEVVSMIKNMDQLFRDMRVKMQHSKEVWHRNSRRVSPGDILARILQQEDRRRVHAGLQVLASPPALSSPATPAELNEDAFIRSWVTEILAERILAACESMLYRELKSRNG